MTANTHKHGMMPPPHSAYSPPATTGPVLMPSNERAFRAFGDMFALLTNTQIETVERVLVYVLHHFD